MADHKALVENAVNIFNEGFNCAQSAYVALAENWGFETEPKVAACFGGGIGRTGGACGVLTGSLMALGLLCGNENPSDIEKKERASALARKFIEAFRETNDAIDCNALTGVDISTADGHAAMGTRDTKQTICVPVMQKTMLLMQEFVKKEGLID